MAVLQFPKKLEESPEWSVILLNLLDTRNVFQKDVLRFISNNISVQFIQQERSFIRWLLLSILFREWLTRRAS
jgi:hypothetical protein